MTWEFWLLYVSVVSPLALLAYVVNRLCDRMTRLETRCDDIENVENFTGAIRWPIEPDEWLMEGLRDEAGDEDDTKRQQLEAVVRIADWRH
jgi:hypothetical protein